MSKRIIYKDRTWFAMPNHVHDLLPILTAGELRLYIALLARGRGFVHNLEVSNQALMNAANLNERSLPAARGGLKDRNIVLANPVNGRREVYRYSFHENLDDGVIKPVSADAGQASALLRIPDDALMGALNPKPTLNGK